MSKTSKIFLYSVFSIVALLMMIVLLSPFGRDKKDLDRNIKAEIEINAPVADVYQYLGNSANVVHWSAYMDHATPLNPYETPDGTLGSTRRCYTQADEKGATWDEVILLADPNRTRQLSIYSLQNFTIRLNGLAIEQVYEPLGTDKTKLTVKMFYMNDEERLFQLFKTHIASYRIKHLFKKDLENIKKEIEQARSK